MSQSRQRKFILMLTLLSKNRRWRRLHRQTSNTRDVIDPATSCWRSSRAFNRRQDYAELTCESMLFQARQQRVGSSYRWFTRDSPELGIVPQIMANQSFHATFAHALPTSSSSRVTGNKKGRW